MNVPFLQDSSFTGLISTQNYGTSYLWNLAYTLVQSNSATWEESADIIPTVTNYLSTNNVLISGIRVATNLTAIGDISSGNIIYALDGNSNQWNQAYTTSTTYQNASSSFYQTLSYTPSSIQISISNGNTITLDNLITKTQALAYSIAL